MRACLVRKWCLVVPALAWASGVAWSQVAYLCSADGRTYYSVQPCPSRPTPVRSVGPTLRETRAPATTPVRTPDKPEEHLQYLSPRCAELSEGVRTGASRGLGNGSQQALRDAYQRSCSEEESRARERLKDEQGRQRDLRDQEAKTARLEQDRDRLTREQCAEMLRIAAVKRQRLDAMTAGERADFDRFDATRRARCGL